MSPGIPWFDAKEARKIAQSIVRPEAGQVVSLFYLGNFGKFENATAIGCHPRFGKLRGVFGFRSFWHLFTVVQ
jgi:hypothetical protein